MNEFDEIWNAITFKVVSPKSVKRTLFGIPKELR